MPKEEHNPVLAAAIMEVVENQLRQNDPPETKQTYERLLMEGHTEVEAKRLIACVVSSEIFGILKRKEQYDRARYVAGLERLPKMPWEND